MSKPSVYHLNRAELPVGDHVRITHNDAQHDLVNGQLAKVVAIDAASVTIEADDRRVRLPTDRPLHMNYAYTTTAHSAQDTYYVSISRERHEVVVFTDDASKLPERVDRLTYKGLAHDLEHGKEELEPATLKVEPELDIE